MNRAGTGKENVKREEFIDFQYYWSVISRHKWNIIGLVLVSTMLTLLILFSLQRVYRASTTVLIESEQAKIVSIEDVYGANTKGKEYFLTQFEILKSRELAERVVKRLNLIEHPLFDPAQDESFSIRKLLGLESKSNISPGDKFSSVISKFRSGLSISPVRNTQLVNINYESQDPKLAALIANTMAEEYIQSQMEAKLSVTVKAANWLTERLDGLKTTLQESEQKLQEYRDQAGLVDVKGVQTLDADELTELTQRYVEATKARSEVESVFRQANSLGEGVALEKLLSMPSILLDPMVQSMKEEQARADRKVAELSNRYGPKHPKMIAARSDADQARNNLSVQVTRVRQGLEAKYYSALQTERTLQAQIQDAKNRFKDVNRKEFKLRELEREVETNRQMYDMFLTRAKETSEAEGLQAAHARVVDPAVVPQSAVKPNKRMYLFLSFVASLTAGVSLAFLLESLNNTFRTPEDIEEKLNLPMLGFLPLDLGNKSTLPFEGFTPKTKGVFAEAIRTIRTALVLSGIDTPQKIVVITSSVPGEGKSTVSLNLARAMGQMEKVLLIDADMRRPTLSRVLDLPKGSPGLSNWVAGTAKASEIIYKMDDWDADVMPSGVIPHNPLELISSKRFKLALEKLKEHYDRIIIDSAPVCAVSDALMLSTLADALVYVTKADATSADLTLKGVNRLREVDAPLVGVVLNQVNVKKSTRYGEYYQGYYQNYGYSSEEEFQAQKKYQRTKDGEHKYEQRKVAGIEDI